LIVANFGANQELETLDLCIGPCLETAWTKGNNIPFLISWNLWHELYFCYSIV